MKSKLEERIEMKDKERIRKGEGIRRIMAETKGNFSVRGLCLFISRCGLRGTY